MESATCCGMESRLASMESMRSIVWNPPQVIWNHSSGMYGIRNLLRYGISPCEYGINAKHCMESTIGGMESFQRNVWNQERRGRRYTLSRDEIQGRKTALDDILAFCDKKRMIYQVCDLDKKILVPKNEDFWVKQAF